MKEVFHKGGIEMEKGQIYTQERIQSVWSQFHYKPHSVVWSDDNGESWNDVPSMDTGKWAMSTMKDGNKVKWIFKIR
jgi:hypothetical protein